MSTKENSRILPTSSFDALLRLSKLDDSIQDALSLRDTLASELDQMVHSHRTAFVQKGQVDQTQDFAKTIHYATSTVAKQLKALQQKRQEKQRALHHRRQLLHTERQTQATILDHIHSHRPELANLREQIAILQKSTAAQRRRISTDLSKIYPIHPIPDQPLSFTIRSLHLPNSEDLDTKTNKRLTTPDIMSASLGHISHALQLLSFYWDIQLPYPPTPRSSTSIVYDPISLLQSATNTPSSQPHLTPALPSTRATTASSFSSSSSSLSPRADRATRTFLLTPRNQPRFRFEYALFLLNKDIQLLLESAWSLRLLDIRQTLPNLAYAFYCATAGEGELVARKAGGVRGLMRDTLDNSLREPPDGALRHARGDSEDSSVVGSPTIRGGQADAFETLKRVGRVRERKLA